MIIQFEMDRVACSLESLYIEQVSANVIILDVAEEFLVLVLSNVGLTLQAQTHRTNLSTNPLAVSYIFGTANTL